MIRMTPEEMRQAAREGRAADVHTGILVEAEYAEIQAMGVRTERDFMRETYPLEIPEVAAALDSMTASMLDIEASARKMRETAAALWPIVAHDIWVEAERTRIAGLPWWRRWRAVKPR